MRYLTSLMLIAALFGCTNKEQTHYTDKTNSVNPKAPVAPLDILIDGKRFRLSSDYSSLLGPWDPEKQAFVGYFSFEFDIDTFLPLSRKSREEVRGRVETRTRKVLGGQEELAARLSNDPKYSYLHMVRAPERDKFGLTAYLSREQQHPHEILVGAAEDGEVYVLNCQPVELFPGAICEIITLYKGLQLTIVYRKAFLSQWREINQKTLTKISSFIVSEQK